MHITKFEANRIILENHYGDRDCFMKFCLFTKLGIKTIDGISISPSIFE